MKQDRDLGTGAAHRSRPLLPLAVLVVLVVGAVGAFVASRRVIEDQKDRLLRQRTAEIQALLDTSFENIDASLQVLGLIGSSTEDAARRLFAEGAAPLVEDDTDTVGVAVEGNAGFAVRAVAGAGGVDGEVLTGDRAAVMRRALEAGEVVSALLVGDNETRLVLARPVPRSRAVAYQESVIDPSRAVPTPPGSPFEDMRIVLYASPRVDASQLVLTTEADVPLKGRVERVPFSVGADTWLLAVGTRGSLVGSLAENIPWILLAGGLVSAALASGVIQTLARRRAYALALVDERTGALGEALDELGRTQAFLERLVTAGPVLVRRLTVPEREVTYVSPNVERLFGMTEADVMAPGALHTIIHPDDADAFWAVHDRVADGSSDEAVVEYRRRRGDGTYRWVSAVVVPEFDEDGRRAAVLDYVIDIDDRRRAEEARWEAQDAAEAANRSKSEFLSRMSHELRTPLNAVLGFGQLLEMEELSDSQRDAVDYILKGGRHLLDLIDEVLDISRIETGRLPLSPEPVLASRLLGETMDLVRPLADEQHIQLVGTASEECDCYVLADRQRAKQVLLNLLSNAIKYNRPRGTVAVSCRQTDDAWLRISVTDTGPGIPADRRDLLFVPFERLGAELTAVEGTGIGLALSQRLAEAMGGSIGVDSTVGRGSTFWLDLPRVEGPEDRFERLNGDSKEPVPPSTTDRHAVVLHIEDNLSNLNLVERVLSQRPGVEVVAAMQGSLGVELAREHRPRLILLDLHLPDLGGDQVLQRLRDDPVTRSIPVVMISADATPGQVARLLSAGATAYLTKPIDVRDLLRVIDEAIEER